MHLGHVVLRLLENRFIVLKVTLEPFHFAFNRSDLTLHLNNLISDLVGPTLTCITSVFGDGLLEVLLQLENLALVDHYLRPKVLGLFLIPLGHLAMRHCKLTLHMRILVILG